MTAPAWYWQRFGWFVIQNGTTAWAVVDDFGNLVIVAR
jgi:hypothetical protein